MTHRPLVSQREVLKRDNCVLRDNGADCRSENGWRNQIQAYIWLLNCSFFLLRHGFNEPCNDNNNDDNDKNNNNKRNCDDDDDIHRKITMMIIECRIINILNFIATDILCIQKLYGLSHMVTGQTKKPKHCNTNKIWRRKRTRKYICTRKYLGSERGSL